MATTKKTYGDIVDSNNKIGNYTESTGGGTPIKKGEKIDYHAKNSDDADRYRATHPKAVVRVDQPRDEEGHFTYNSANKKTRRFEAHGNGTAAERDSHKRAAASSESQVPPWLRNVEATFAQKSGKAALVQGGKAYRIPDDITFQQFIDRYKEFKKDTGFGIASLENVAKGRGGKVGSTMTVSSFVSKYSQKTAQNKKRNATPSWSKPTNSTPQQPQSQNNSTPQQPQSQNNSTPRKPSSDGVDYGMIKTDKQKFMNDNIDALDEIDQMAQQKGISLDIDQIVDDLGSGELEDFAQVKDIIKNYAV